MDIADLSKVWFAPLFLTPIFAIEVFICLFCGRSLRIAFVTYTLVLLLGTFVVYEQASNRSVLSTATGFAVHDTLRPRAILPYTMVIEVKAVSLNPVDYKLINNIPLIPFLRWVLPVQSPAADYAGVVKAVGPSCEGVKAGDRVWGTSLGSMQQYILGTCLYMGKIPNEVSFAQGAAYPIAGVTGMCAFQHYKGGSVLIVGASGGCGQAGVLLAKARKVEPIYCVSSKKNHDLVLSMGCTEAFDYKDANFESTIVSKLKGKVGMVYDVVSELDTYYLKLLNQTLVNDGTYVGLAPLFFSGYQNYVSFSANPTCAEMEYPYSHPEIFQLKIAYSGLAFEPKDVNEAYKLLKTQRTAGKIILKVSE
jgi:D-arabinose 1-dehydrogenase-like Zn-dependent alcohol dehydrogenase